MIRLHLMGSSLIVIPVDHIDRFLVLVKYIFLNESTNQLEKNNEFNYSKANKQSTFPKS